MVSCAGQETQVEVLAIQDEPIFPKLLLAFER
jgi:hypothetical protein